MGTASLLPGTRWASNQESKEAQLCSVGFLSASDPMGRGSKLLLEPHTAGKLDGAGLQQRPRGNGAAGCFTESQGIDTR